MKNKILYSTGLKSPKLFLIISVMLIGFNLFAQENETKDSFRESKVLSLDDCISIALENNHKIKASRYGINIAETQIKQAESGYYPHLSLNANYTLMDQDPLFVMPSFNLSLPAIIPGINLGDIQIPQQNVKVMDKQNINTGLELIYPVYTGGKISSVNKQAEYGYDIAIQESRKTDSEIIYDVKRYYYSFMLSKNLLHIGEEALERLNATLNLTESLYKNGSGKVTKIDYLKNKIVVDQVSTIITELRRNVKTIKDALAFTLSRELPDDFETLDKEIPYLPSRINADDLYTEAYKSNPDWTRINSAVDLYQAKIDESASGYFPSVALFASVNHTFNSYDYGYVNPNDVTRWVVGLGLEFPIFSGFSVDGKVAESEAELEKIKEEKLLLKNAIILQINEAYYKVISTSAQVEKILEAKKTAEENSSLTERAFQQDIVEASDLVEAQIMESIVSAQYQKALFDHVDARAKLEFILGK